MIDKFFSVANAFLWGPPMLSLFVGTGFIFTVRSGFFQVRHIKKWLHDTLFFALRNKESRKSRNSKSISQYQALTAALAACMGTGNIVGVATAIRAGGPGAVFWMCFSAFLGMMTSCAESTLGIIYRRKNINGDWIGGAMMYIDKGLGMKKTAKLYALLLMLSSFGIGNMTQANSVASILSGSYSIPPYITGAVLTVISAAVILGGIKRIAVVSEKVVPFISVVFVVSSLVVIAINYKKVPSTALLILREAFSFKSAAAGAVGYGISKAARFGVARGVFSNEAGLGTSAIIHAAADVDRPAEQGMWGILEVFLDTIVMCTVTSFVILTSGAWQAEQSLDGAELFGAAFSSVLGGVGNLLLAVTISLLAFASLTGWSYYGERSTEYFLGLRAVPFYRLAFIAAIFIGSVTGLQTVWNLADILNCLMALPNLAAILMLSGEALHELRKI
ncbi:MAG: sodium:alanine symporter family protein [Clostridiales bacterium]|jgi:AGCS family alanine or glycine:cation symporter|nr:sodium:alanine symporter family protein [Clostridiales bacterium]